MTNDIVKNVYDLRERIKEKHGENAVKPTNNFVYEARDLDELYFNTILGALKKGILYKIDSGSHEGSHRIELRHASLTITNPLQESLAPRSRPGIPVSTDDKSIDNYFHNYIISGIPQENEHYTYGGWIVGIPRFARLGDKGLKKYLPRYIPLKHKGVLKGTRFNQLEWCAKHFVKKGFGNNHPSITIGCAEGLKRYDWPYDGPDDPKKGSTECLRQITFKIRENELDLTCFFRSWDLVGGLPQNLGGMIKLMDYTATLINAQKRDDQPEVKPGVLHANSDGLHVYEHDLDIAKLWVNMME